MFATANRVVVLSNVSMGFDLFNFGFYWEAHEAWEEVWISVGRSGDAANFVKGLIKLAAAGVKLREGRATGVERHALRSAALFEKVAETHNSTLFCGCDLDKLSNQASEVASKANLLLNTSQVSSVVVMPFSCASPLITKFTKN